MAGGSGYQPVKLDQGLEAWNYMRENIWRYFRFTQKTSRLSLFWGALVPIGVFAICQQQDLKWDVVAAKRDDPIARWGEHAKRPSERASAAAPADDEE